MVLDIDPISGRILNQMNSPVTDKLKMLNDNYLSNIKEDLWRVPIPFFANIEDRRFFEKTKIKKWNLFGID